MDNIAKEIILYNKCINKDMFYETLTKLLKNINNNIVIMCLRKLEKCYEQYVEKLLEKQIIDYDNIAIKNIGTDSLLNNLIIVNNFITIDNKITFGYNFLKSYIKYYENIDTLYIMNFDPIDYTSCFLTMYNYYSSEDVDIIEDIEEKINKKIIYVENNITDHKKKDIKTLSYKIMQNKYSKEEDETFIFSDNIKDNVRNIIDKKYKNIIYITDDIIRSYYFNILNIINYSYIYTYFNINYIRTDVNTEYKQAILHKLKPVYIYDINVITDTNNANNINDYVLFKCENKKCSSFTLKHFNGNINAETNEEKENKKITYINTSDWLSDKEPMIVNKNRELYKNLRLFELDIQYAKEKANILENYNEPYFNNNFEKHFHNMSISNEILKIVHTKEILLKDCLEPIKPPRYTTIKKTKSGPYPLVSASKNTNGISMYIDTYDTDCNEYNKILTVGLRKNSKGVAFVHSYKFAHTQEVALFTLRKCSENQEIDKMLKNNSINLYNIAFGLNEYMKNKNDEEILSKRDINIKDILNTKINVIYFDKKFK